MIDTGILAEIIGWIAFTISVASCLSQQGRKIIFLQVPSNFFWTIHLSMIGAFGGALSCFLAMIRNFLGLKLNDTHSKIMVIAFIPIGFLLAYMFGESHYAYMTAFASVVMSLSIIVKENARLVRICNAGSRTLWLVYGVIVGSLPTVLLELVCLGSLAYATLRYDPAFEAIRDKLLIKQPV